MRVAPCDEPNSCPGSKRSKPTADAPRDATRHSAALPMAPSPTTATSAVLSIWSLATLQPDYMPVKVGRSEPYARGWLRVWSGHLADRGLKYSARRQADDDLPDHRLRVEQDADRQADIHPVGGGDRAVGVDGRLEVHVQPGEELDHPNGIRLPVVDRHDRETGRLIAISDALQRR